MSLATVFLVLPVFSAPDPAGIDPLLEEHAGRPAAESVASLLDAVPQHEGTELSVTRFLLAGALSELGLVELAAAVLRAELDSPFIGGAAFVAWLRTESEGGGERRILRAARHAPWETVSPDDLPEALWRVARAAFVTSRHAEARVWARRVPEDSPWHPFACYLLAQIEYALGRPHRAIAAAEPIFSAREPADAIEPLRERTAVLLGDMLIEIGLYERAADVLSWPVGDGAFGERSRRDRLIALGLLALERKQLDLAQTLAGQAIESLDRAGEEIERTVRSESSVAARVTDLRRSWPPRSLVEGRRRWSVERARDALERSHGWTLRRIAATVWESLPPVVLWRLAAQESEPSSPAVARIDESSRFFFTPGVEVSRLLLAAAVLEDETRSCRASAIRRHAVAALLGLAAGGNVTALTEVSCDDPLHADLETVLRRRLNDGVEAAARRRLRALREGRFVLDDAIARARVARLEEAP